MRILMALGLLTYWLSHPGAVQQGVRLAALALAALAHVGGDHATAAGLILVLGSHWH
jgi:hypothetical protein